MIAIADPSLLTNGTSHDRPETNGFHRPKHRTKRPAKTTTQSTPKVTKPRPKAQTAAQEQQVFSLRWDRQDRIALHSDPTHSFSESLLRQACLRAEKIVHAAGHFGYQFNPEIAIDLRIRVHQGKVRLYLVTTRPTV